MLSGFPGGAKGLLRSRAHSPEQESKEVEGAGRIKEGTKMWAQSGAGPGKVAMFIYLRPTTDS